MTGERSDNPLAPNFVPTLFKHIDSLSKRKLVRDMDNFVRRQDMKRRRLASDTVDSDSEEEANKEMIEELAAEDQLFAKDQLMYV